MDFKTKGKERHVVFISTVFIFNLETITQCSTLYILQQVFAYNMHINGN